MKGRFFSYIQELELDMGGRGSSLKVVYQIIEGSYLELPCKHVAILHDQHLGSGVGLVISYPPKKIKSPPLLFWPHTQTSSLSNGPRTHASLLLSNKLGQHSTCLGRNKMSAVALLFCTLGVFQCSQTTGPDHTQCRQPNVPESDGFECAQKSSQKAGSLPRPTQGVPC